MFDATTLPRSTFFLVTSPGAIVDRVLCDQCLGNGRTPLPTGSTWIVLSHATIAAELSENGGAGGCELCGADYPRSEFADRAWRHWLREAAEKITGERLTAPEFDKLNAAISFRDYFRGEVGEAVLFGRADRIEVTADNAARSARQLATWARRIPESIGLQSWNSEHVASLRAEGLC